MPVITLTKIVEKLRGVGTPSVNSRTSVANGEWRNLAQTEIGTVNSPLAVR